MNELLLEPNNELLIRAKSGDLRTSQTNEGVIVACANPPAPTPTPQPQPQVPSGVFVAPTGNASAQGSITNPLSLAAVLAAKIEPGQTAWLRGGVYSVPGAKLLGTETPVHTGLLAGTAEKPITIRAYPGERAVIDGGIDLKGAYVTLRDVEVSNSSSDRTQARPAGVGLSAAGCKVINCVVHDCGNGITMFSGAPDAEVYGCIIFRNGWEAVGDYRGHGHGLYIQNQAGKGNGKLIQDVISFDHYSTGMKAYTEQGFVENVTFDGIISFNNGSPARPLPNYDRMWNIFVGSIKNPTRNVTVINCCTWHPQTANGESVLLGYQSPGSQGLIVRDNYFTGGNSALRVLTDWQDVTIERNTLIGTGQTVQLPKTAAAWTVTGNQQLRPSSAPNRVFVRPNKYEQGRAHVAVYNWSKAPSVAVDLSSVLKAGDKFEIFDVRDLFGKAILSGNYGGPVSVPVAGEFMALLIKKAQ